MECAAFIRITAEQPVGEADRCFAVQGMRAMLAFVVEQGVLFNPIEI